MNCITAYDASGPVMTSSDENYEDVRDSNGESECEDESKLRDVACDPMEDDEDGIRLTYADVQELLLLGTALRSEIPGMNNRIRRLESAVGLLVALMVLASFA